MSLESTLAKVMDGYLSRDGRDRDLVRPPWDDLEPELKLKLPFYLRLGSQAGRLFFGIGLACTVIGYFAEARALTAFGASMLVLVMVSYREAWLALSSVSVKSVHVPERLTENEELKITISCAGVLQKTRAMVITRVTFSGSKQAERYHIGTASLGRKIHFAIPADIGMGKYQLGGIMIATSDRLGLFTLCAAVPFAAEVEVLPKDVPLHGFAVHCRGQSMHAGQFSTRFAGGSASFLALRPWRFGDSVRQIDWKRSQRYPELLVKEFEHTAATDATIFIDQNPLGHCSFKGVSSMESMRESVLSLVRDLLAQQIRVRLVGASVATDPGVGSAHADLMAEVVRNMGFDSDVGIVKLLEQFLPLIAPDSLVVICVCTANNALGRLWESIVGLDDRRVETVIVAFDSEAFATQVRQEAGLLGDKPLHGHLLLANLAIEERMAAGHEHVGLLHKLAHRTYFIGPGKTLADVYFD